jgi:hypothetical protein
MLAELSEGAARGPVAGIYDDIRRLWAVPYVSSLQRHLATKPGWLEWSWSTLAPAFLSGAAQTVAWRLAAELKLPPLPRIEPGSIGLDGNDVRMVKDICASFVRVAPVNLMFAGLLRRLLNGQVPDGAGWPDLDQSPPWSPPPMTPSLPAMLDIKAAPDEIRAALLRLGTDVDGVPFVPGLYRILAHWPALIQKLADLLPALKNADETEAARVELLRRIDGAVGEIFATLPAHAPALAPVQMPSPRERDAVLAVLDTYRRTSPEMVIFGQVISNAMNSAS